MRTDDANVAIKGVIAHVLQRSVWRSVASSRQTSRHPRHKWPWCWIHPHHVTNSHPTKALSSVASPHSRPRHFIYFSAFLNSLSPWVRLVGGKGAGSPDMNRPSPRRVLVGSSHGSEVPWHTGCTQRSHCQRNLSRFGWFFFLLLLLLLNEGVNLNLNKNPLLSLFTGYFMYDFFDMLFNQKLSHSWELLFHHLVVGLSSISSTSHTVIVPWPAMLQHNPIWWENNIPAQEIVHVQLDLQVMCQKKTTTQNA